MSRDNKRLGTFHLDGIPPAPRGVPQIEVTFDIDANGILNVSAKDLGTGRENKISVTGSSGLSKEEVERLRREAEEHAAEDASRREEAETRNSADSLSYQAEKQLKDFGDKIPEGAKSELETLIAKTRDALKGSDVSAIKAASTELQNKLQSASEEFYKAAATAGPGAGGGDAGAGATASEPKSGDVVDAEFEVVDDKAKNNQ
jgi:molecular chaperone DnaK